MEILSYYFLSRIHGFHFRQQQQPLENSQKVSNVTSTAQHHYQKCKSSQKRLKKICNLKDQFIRILRAKVNVFFCAPIHMEKYENINRIKKKTSSRNRAYIYYNLHLSI